jgi:hypothetical protein
MAHTHDNEPRQILSVSRYGCQHNAVSYDNLRVNRVLCPTGNHAGSERGCQVPEAKAEGRYKYKKVYVYVYNVEYLGL